MVNIIWFQECFVPVTIKLLFSVVTNEHRMVFLKAFLCLFVANGRQPLKVISIRHILYKGRKSDHLFGINVFQKKESLFYCYGIVVVCFGVNVNKQVT